MGRQSNASGQLMVVLEDKWALALYLLRSLC